MEKDFEEFKEYVENSRAKFVEKFWQHFPLPSERVVAEDLLICFDQVFARYKAMAISSNAVLAVSLPPEKIGTIELSEREKEQVAKNFKDVFGGNDR